MKMSGFYKQMKIDEELSSVDKRFFFKKKDEET